ncbi:hypothetical protein [Streptomyces sp. NPDC095613]|uniref:hypothetical protein n=1 Tax=Streptomyces sp. NPDC095613 TaxID=3155540 RepID=UPI00332A6E6A
MSVSAANYGQIPPDQFSTALLTTAFLAAVVSQLTTDQAQALTSLLELLAPLALLAGRRPAQNQPWPDDLPESTVRF